MYLKRLSLVNFKNYASAELAFSPRFNIISGNNGGGKTNLLDAIHYLSFCKSFFNPIDSQNITHELPFFVIQGQMNDDELYCGLKRNQKKQFKRNKKEYDRLSDHIGLYPVVMVSPADAELINEGSESRRRFVDTVISQLDKSYLDQLIQYSKIISHRNALLKQFYERRSFNVDELEIWDEQLAGYGKLINSARKLFMQNFEPIFESHYRWISGGAERVKLDYQSQLNQTDFSSLLVNAREKDRIMQYSTVGIHKDDVELLINGVAVKKFASQGQQKSFVLALKLAQYDFIKNAKGFAPILLLDDIYDKLDESRMQQMLMLVGGDNFGQVFITDTHEGRVASLLKRNNVEVKEFVVNGGVVAELLVNS